MELFKYFLPPLIALTFACSNRKEKSINDECLTKYPNDSADYKFFKYDFYKGKDGCTYEKKIRVDKFTPPYCYDVFYTKFLDKYEEDTIIQILLDSIIDFDSFISFDSSSYSKDKYRCYNYVTNTDGGFRGLMDLADPATFTTVKNKEYDAEDKNHKYKNGEIIGFDSATIIIENSSQAKFARYMVAVKGQTIGGQNLEPSQSHKFKISLSGLDLYRFSIYLDKDKDDKYSIEPIDYFDQVSTMKLEKGKTYKYLVGIDSKGDYLSVKLEKVN